MVCAAVSGAEVGSAPHRALSVVTHTVFILSLCDKKRFFKKIVCTLTYSRTSLSVFCLTVNE